MRAVAYSHAGLIEAKDALSDVAVNAGDQMRANAQIESGRAKGKIVLLGFGT